MPDNGMDLIRESVDLLILKALSGGAKRAEALQVWIRRATRTTVNLDEGVLLPVLHRLIRRRMIRVVGEAETPGGAAKLYELTPIGMRQLVTRSSRWRRQIGAIEGALAMPTSEAAW